MCVPLHGDTHVYTCTHMQARMETRTATDDMCVAASFCTVTQTHDAVVPTGSLPCKMLIRLCVYGHVSVENVWMCACVYARSCVRVFLYTRMCDYTAGCARAPERVLCLCPLFG